MKKKKNDKKEKNSQISKKKTKSFSENESIFKNNYDNSNIGANIGTNMGTNIIGNILEVNDIKKFEKNTEFQKNKTNKKKITTVKKLSIEEYIQPGNFKFIKIIKTMKDYNKKYFQTKYNRNYKMIINILMDDDSLNSSKNLLKIFELIASSLNSLNQVKIDSDNFLVCVFFQHFTHEIAFKNLFPNLNFYNCNNSYDKSDKFYCSFGSIGSNNKINIVLFYKEASTFIEIYKFFYTCLLSDIIVSDSSQNNSNILIVNWPNGKIFSSNNENKKDKKVGKGGTIKPYEILAKISKLCKNENMVLIPDINYKPHSEDKIFGFINKFCLNNDKIKINLSWYVTFGYPIDHRFFFISMKYDFFSVLKEYYSKEKIKIYASEYYHDYHLAVYLKKHMKNITIQKILDVNVEYDDLPWNLMNYFHDFIIRRGSEFANFFNAFNYFFSCITCDNKKIIPKIFLFFRLIFEFLQFFWLGITFLVVYSVFNDTFGSTGNKMDYFCSLGYVIMTIILLSISVIYVQNQPKIKYNKIHRNMILNRDSNGIIIVLYIIHYLYFFFFIICAGVAIIHIKDGRYEDIHDSDHYIFNSKLFIIILFVNLFLFLLPSFFRFSNIISRGFLFYIFLHIPNCLTFYHFPYLFTGIRNINSKSKKKESLYIIFYLVLNGILTVICLVFDTSRQRRMDFLFIVAEIISALNIIHLISTIIGICSLRSFRKKCLKIFNENFSNNDTNNTFLNDSGYCNPKNDNKKENSNNNSSSNNINPENEEENKDNSNSNNNSNNNEYIEENNDDNFDKSNNIINEIKEDNNKVLDINFDNKKNENELENNNEKKEKIEEDIKEMKDENFDILEDIQEDKNLNLNFEQNITNSFFSEKTSSINNYKQNLNLNNDISNNNINLNNNEINNNNNDNDENYKFPKDSTENNIEIKNTDNIFESKSPLKYSIKSTSKNKNIEKDNFPHDNKESFSSNSGFNANIGTISENDIEEDIK